MTIGIIICTHGCAGEEILKSAEMLLGKQKNIASINFMLGENTEILTKKFETQLNSLNTETGLLFFVDTWGGTPFNSASYLIINKKNSDVITGINIPMLVETLMAREDNLEFNELISLAVKTGSESIRQMKRKITEPPIKKDFNDKTKFCTNTDKHMKIVLTRIDDRLIHGQIVTCWTKDTNVSHIIVVSDTVAKDKVRKALLTQVAPPGVSAHVVDINKMVRVWNNPKYIHNRVMLLFTNPTDLLHVVEKGIDIKSINIGGLAYKKGKTQINSAISVDEKDISAFHQLHNRNIELEIRKVPNDPKINIMDLIKKINS